jgi:hypothetical protein
MNYWRALAGVVAVIVLTSCGSTVDAPRYVIPSMPSTVVEHPGYPRGILVVPASNHLTGTYPPRCTAHGQFPDPTCTPGSLRDDIDPQHLELTICKPGWSETILPPRTEFARGKTEAMMVYGVPASDRSITEYDHYLPRGLGGSNNRNNVWPEVSDEPGKGFHNSKDEVEDRVHRAVCAGKVPWADAVLVFAADWTTATQRLGLMS